MTADAEATVVDPNPRFPTTHWTAVLTAGDGAHPEARRALSEFCRQYWSPVFHHIRARGTAHQDAEDLTQQFFTFLIEKQTLGGVTKEGGKFRSFILAALRNFLSHQYQHQRAQKRGGGQKPAELDGFDTAHRNAVETADGGAPDEAFDRSWGLNLLEKALGSLAEEYRRQKNGAQWEVLQSYLTGAADEMPYAVVAGKLGTSEANIKVMIHRMRKRFGAILREEVAATVDSDEVADEIRWLMQAVAKSI